MNSFRGNLSGVFLNSGSETLSINKIQVVQFKLVNNSFLLGTPVLNYQLLNWDYHETFRKESSKHTKKYQFLLKILLKIRDYLKIFHIGTE